MDKQREKLIELIHSADLAFMAKGIEMIENAMNEDLIEKIISRQEFIADHLLANGVIVPPCKVGCKLYWLKRDPETYDWYIYQAEVDSIRAYDDTMLIYTSAICHIWADDIGKTVFLSREDAERAIKNVTDINVGCKGVE